MIPANPSRGEIWLADLDSTRGHEQAGQRPVLVVSEDLFNRGPAGLLIVLPLTTVHRGIPSHVSIVPPEGGLKTRSVILCEAIRSIARERLVRKWGSVSPSTMAAVEDRLRILLGL
ncbi:MAG: type II toxin-antitoxin system PemK/MazF family toxin [Deinococcus sp.]|nr:type II toxin-antitoxin system PemK/MazF family toxin [Deinococcus sp.]